MYESYFGFKAKPFKITPDSRFLYPTQNHKRAMAYVQYGLHQADGIVLITGEVGAGKTTLISDLLSRLNPNKVVSAHMVSTQFDGNSLLRYIANLFSLEIPANSDKAYVFLSLQECLFNLQRAGKRALVVIDEAQNLSLSGFEELRMLSNLQYQTKPVVQLVLIGHPELRDKIRTRSMEQLRQRIIASTHLKCLEDEEIQAYIEHRLKKVGWKGQNPSFHPDVFTYILKASRGLPRIINLICDRMLLSLYLAEGNQIEIELAEEVIADIETEIGQPATHSST